MCFNGMLNAERPSTILNGIATFLCFPVFENVCVSIVQLNVHVSQGLPDGGCGDGRHPDREPDALLYMRRGMRMYTRMCPGNHVHIVSCSMATLLLLLLLI